MEIDFRSLGSSTIETEKFFWSWLIYDSTEKIASDRSNHKDITNFGYNSGDNKKQQQLLLLVIIKNFNSRTVWPDWTLNGHLGNFVKPVGIYRPKSPKIHHFSGENCHDNFFYKNGPFPASFSLCSSIQYSWQYMFNIFFANNWIQTTDFWNWKRPLYQLSHINCHDNLWATFHSTLLVTLLKDGMWSF